MKRDFFPPIFVPARAQNPCVSAPLRLLSLFSTFPGREERKSYRKRESSLYSGGKKGKKSQSRRNTGVFALKSAKTLGKKPRIKSSERNSLNPTLPSKNRASKGQEGAWEVKQASATTNPAPSAPPRRSPVKSDASQSIPANGFPGRDAGGTLTRARELGVSPNSIAYRM